MEGVKADVKKKEPAMMRAVAYEPGGPEKLHIGCSKIPELKHKQVLIKVYASAINRADTLQRQGKYPSPAGESDILGLEAAGKIEKLGPDCTKWQKGDHVMALLGGGGNAEYVAVSEDLVMPVPKGMSFKEAASIPEVWLTAYQLLHLCGNVQPGNKVLIHAAGSGVGLAAVQLAKMAKADVYVTAGSQTKIDAAIQNGARAGFNYKDGAFSDAVLAATDGLGVDLILDCIGGSFWQQNSAVIALDGRWILYGLLGLGRVEGDFLSVILGKRVRLQGTTLRTRSPQYKAELVKQFSANALPAFENGTLRTVIDSEFPLGRIGEAHRHMESNQNIGKIVLLVRGDIDEPDSTVVDV